MNFKYTLLDALIEKARRLRDFANGGTQATFKLKNGIIYKEGLLSNSKWIMAMRGYKDLPFLVSDIEDIFQSEEDKYPKEKGGWDFWDNWS